MIPNSNLIEKIKTINPHIKNVIENVTLKKLYISWNCGHGQDSVKWANFSTVDALISYMRAMHCSACEGEFKNMAEILRLEQIEYERNKP